jgi:hypothetical protein
VNDFVSAANTDRRLCLRRPRSHARMNVPLVGMACFASVEAAEVMGGMGHEFIGVLKTATKRCPMAILSGHELSRHGEQVALVAKSTSGEVKMMAMTWVDSDRCYLSPQNLADWMASRVCVHGGPA